MSTPTEKPINFTPDMVTAIVNERKTQTRRPIKLPKHCQWIPNLGDFDDGFFEHERKPGYWHAEELTCPFGEIGDRLSVDDDAILLEIVNVGVSRLQDISEADAEAEGIERFLDGHKTPGEISECETSFLHGRSAAKCFKSLWQSIYGAESWDANPWVWVVEFKRVEL